MKAGGKTRLGQGLSYIAVFALFVLIFYPFLLLIMSSFKHYMQLIKEPWFFSLPLHLSNYGKAFGKIWITMINSFVVTTMIIVMVEIVASLAAFSFARFCFPGKTVLFFFIIMLMMVPGFVILIPTFILIKNMGIFNTYLAQAFPPVAQGTAMAVLLMRTFFQGIPRSLIEAAEIEGAGNLRIFAGITIPLSKPIIATVAIINGLHGWNNYIWPLVCTSGTKVRPVIIALVNLTGTINEGEGLKLAGYAIASLPLIILFLFATKPFVSGLTAGAVKG